MFSKRPREHIVGVPLLLLYVVHFGALLEDEGSGQKALFTFSVVPFDVR